MKLNRNCAIFDIDGTIADNAHRQHFIDHANYHGTSKEGWAKFREAIPLDKPIMAVVDVLAMIKHASRSIVLCTGRSEGDRLATQAWLSKYGIPYDALYMRASDCFRPDAVVKAELLDRILADGWYPQIVFDDRQSVVDMWRARGLVCAQVAKGDF